MRQSYLPRTGVPVVAAAFTERPRVVDASGGGAVLATVIGESVLGRLAHTMSVA